jgi:hypothetical protein
MANLNTENPICMNMICMNLTCTKMIRVKPTLVLLLGCLIALQFSVFPAFAVGNDETAYVGGTEKIDEGAEGSASSENEKEFVFEYKDGQLVIPYDQVTELEYGQQAGHRVGLSIAMPLVALAKKRRHFLTISWKDEKAQEHSAVFELGKSIVKSTIETIETKTGKKVDFQDDDARKSMGGM